MDPVKYPTDDERALVRCEYWKNVPFCWPPNMSEMSDQQVLFQEQLQVCLLDNQLTVEMKVMTTFLTHLSFVFLRNPYTFTIQKWRARGFATLFEKFHQYQRDVGEFGRFDVDGGMVVVLDQKKNVIRQAVKDVFQCLNQILLTHQRAVLDYAVWYRERNHGDSYSAFITHLTCHCIVHTDFLVPSVQWTLVEFQPAAAAQLTQQ